LPILKTHGNWTYQGQKKLFLEEKYLPKYLRKTMVYEYFRLGESCRKEARDLSKISHNKLIFFFEKLLDLK
jgi:hypothetical protein